MKTTDTKEKPPEPTAAQPPKLTDSELLAAILAELKAMNLQLKTEVVIRDKYR